MRKITPEANASFCSKLFFSWFDAILWEGWKKPLASSDLYDLDLPDRCGLLYEKLEEAVAVDNETGPGMPKMKVECNKPPEIKLLRVLYRMFGLQMAAATTIRFINVSLQLVRT